MGEDALPQLQLLSENYARGTFYKRFLRGSAGFDGGVLSEDCFA